MKTSQIEKIQRAHPSTPVDVIQRAIGLGYTSMSPHSPEKHVQMYEQRIARSARAQHYQDLRRQAAYEIMDHGYMIYDSSGNDAFGYEFTAIDQFGNKVTAEGILSLRDNVLKAERRYALPSGFSHGLYYGAGYKAHRRLQGFAEMPIAEDEQPND